MNHTNSQRIMRMQEKLWVALTKYSDYYVLLGSCKQAVPPAAEIGKSVNSKPILHHSERLGAVSSSRVRGLALTKV